MRRINFYLISLYLSGFVLLVPASIFAAGGGGGGSPPTCSQDIWQCGEWSTCSTQGQQTRTCNLSFDCPNTQDPKPAERQACTPPAPPPAPPQTPPPASNPPPPSPVENPTPVENRARVASPSPCRKSLWQCSDWSLACNADGQQIRTCHLLKECPKDLAPGPQTTQACPQLQCGDKAELKDRVACRLRLNPAGVARELELQYLPEECRALKNKEAQENCEEKYKAFKPCWNLPVGQGRLDCGRQALKLGPGISEEVKKCQGKTGAERVSCQQEIKEKTFSFIKFQFYDLAQRAEDLKLHGAKVEDVAEFVAFVENSKQEFNQASTLSQKRQIILNVRQKWQEFLQKVKNQIS